MKRIDHPSAVDGQFSGGNPSAGIPPTVVTAAWLNGVQEEMCRLIEAQGITLDPGDQDQLAAAILAMIVGELAALTIADVAGLQAALDAKAAAGHTHDDRYFTEAEADERFARTLSVNGNNLELKTQSGTLLGAVTAPFAANAGQLNGAVEATAASANSIAKRDASGNLTAGVFNGTATSARLA